MDSSTDTPDARNERGTADFHSDGDNVRRSVTIRRPWEEVEAAWKASGNPGVVRLSKAPGDRGIEVRVLVAKSEQNALKELLGAYTSDDPGDSLSTLLRQFKARLETGEVPTVHGQSSGREGQAR